MLSTVIAMQEQTMEDFEEDAPGVGHNSGVAGEQLKSFVERVERLMDERASLNADIREVMAEAKATGFDTKIVRAVIKERAKDPNERQEEKHLMEVYLEALGIPW